METKKVEFERIKDVIKFVQLAAEEKEKVTVTKDDYVVDGKSLMGVFSIDPSETIEVTYPANAGELREFLISFEV